MNSTILSLRERVRKIHRVNRLLWLAVLSGMVVLTVVAIVFYQFRLVDWAPQTYRAYDQAVYLAVLFFLFLIFYIKRHYLEPNKLVERVKNRQVVINIEDMADLLHEFGTDYDLLARMLILSRRYLMVIWSIANLILIIGFIYFLLTGFIKMYAIYALISFYSIAINFPAFSYIERCFIKLYDRPLE